MKAEPREQLRLLDLQELDLRLDRLRHRGNNLPEAARAAKLATDAAQAHDREVELRTRVSDLQREIRKLDTEVQKVRERAASDEKLMQSGSITSAKQLQDLEHEIASLARRQAELEDGELELMEQMEQLQAEHHSAEIDRDRLAAESSAALGDRDRALQEVMADGRAATTERRQVAAEISDELRSLYDRIRKEHGGVGAVVFSNGQCGGCRLTMVPSDVSALRGAALDDVLRCDECRRILIRAAMLAQ